MSAPASLYQLLTTLGLTVPILRTRTGFSAARLTEIYQTRNPSPAELASLVSALGPELAAHFTLTASTT